MEQSNKTKLMAILSNLPQDAISNELFLWAASNLPDSSTKGTYNAQLSVNNFTFDHDREGFYEAVGFDIDWAQEHTSKMKSLYENLIRAEGDVFTKSEIFQKLIEADKSFVEWSSVYGFNDLWDRLLKPYGEAILQERKGSSSKSMDDPTLRSLIDKLGFPNPDDLSPDMIKKIIAIDVSKLNSEADIPDGIPDKLREILKQIISAKKRRR